MRSPPLRSSPRITYDQLPLSHTSGSGAHTFAATGHSAASGSGPSAGMDLRAEVKALCVQELQLRFVNARMAHALSVRSRKVRRECETKQWVQIRVPVVELGGRIKKRD